MTIQLAVFDIAGTTVRDDDAVNTCLREALAGSAAVTRADVNMVMGMPKKVAIRTLLELNPAGREAVSQNLVETIYEDFLARMLRYYHTSSLVEPMPYALETFHRLKEAGVKLALDTGFSRPVVDALLARLGWNDGTIFEATVASDEVARGRPYPDLLFRAMALAGATDPRRVAKIGDTPADLQEGMAAGCGWVIGVTNGTHTRAELAAHPHTHLIGDLRELTPILFAGTSAAENSGGLSGNSLAG